ncbi:hypothetical protein BJX61DRAFT_43416 [Aspergillus egyptiacus]|nr:hypothetical protein BJX61DRAFT_43416 [Aspergillus egyptiacus]
MISRASHSCEMIFNACCADTMATWRLIVICVWLAWPAFSNMSTISESDSVAYNPTQLPGLITVRVLVEK